MFLFFNKFLVSVVNLADVDVLKPLGGPRNFNPRWTISEFQKEKKKCSVLGMLNLDLEKFMAAIKIFLCIVLGIKIGILGSTWAKMNFSELVSAW